MIYNLENEKLKVAVNDLGAELMSIYGKSTNFEYLWQGNPEYWKGRATVLFPICGRMTDGKYTYKGKEYEMIIHGFAKKSQFSVAEKTENKIVLTLTDSEESLKIYPFKFVFTVTYTLTGSCVRTEFTVKNTNDGDLRFSLGGHPGFNIPLDEDESFETHYLEFDTAKKRKRLVMSDTCYYTGEKEDFPLVDNKILPLKHSLFDNDAIFLDAETEKVTLKCKSGKRSVCVKFSDMTHLGFWHKPKTEAPYVCIEPWHGVPAYDGKVDDWGKKAELITLAKGKEYKNSFDIILGE